MGMLENKDIKNGNFIIAHLKLMSVNDSTRSTRTFAEFTSRIMGCGYPAIVAVRLGNYTAVTDPKILGDIVFRSTLLTSMVEDSM